MADGLVRWALVVAYDGTAYFGFQFQTNGPTVQGELERALTRLNGVDVRISAASRTDSGAHAIGQVVSFTTQTRLPASAWLYGMNSLLPQDVAIQAAGPVPLGFHPRRDATSREYRYTIYNCPVPMPTQRRVSLWVRQPLDVPAMAAASRSLVGTYDFSAFAGPLGKRNPRRSVLHARVTQQPPWVYFDIAANAFLPQMVRRCAGALLQVGLGRLSVDAFRALLASVKPMSAGPALPAHGLCLMKVNYPNFPLGMK
ncbi:MAG: tRNA pseudouridine(38-40) synthase TruA [Chloroflexi bacterium]|nr:tRNA pseudouridine(38-40) synthase TruA [Chloroflexota bacterium]